MNGDTGERRGLDLPESVRKSLAGSVVERGVQARAISTQGRESMKPPQCHLVVAAEQREIEDIRGPARIVRQLEFYKTFYGPVVRIAFSVEPEEGEPLSGGTLLNISQVSGDAALAGLGRQKTLYVHFYAADPEGRDLTYVFSKELTNGEDQRSEAKKILKLARDAHAGTPEERRGFRAAVGLAEKEFAPPEDAGEGER
ncbi:hypothetical protein [Rubrobacter aplysinae]|uniref:hypothetical protein n=1 Tax=Rubrobacter aplysinae TaxID=909625 RepID=UPI00064BB79D|nr:hypothetical protein [Rubrobacter aplysinae]